MHNSKLNSFIQIVRCLVLVLNDRVKYLLDLDVEQIIQDERYDKLYFCNPFRLLSELEEIKIIC